MFAPVTSRATRTVLALSTALTVGMTGLAGVAHADDDDEDEYYPKHKKVTVEICKKVKHDDGHDYGYHYDHGEYDEDKTYDVYAKTYGYPAKKYVLEDRECEKHYLPYYHKKHKVVVYEDAKYLQDYKVRYKVKKGGYAKYYNGKVAVYFDGYKKYPYVKIEVINKEKYPYVYYTDKV